MRPLKILTDTTCDLSPEYTGKYGITLIPGHSTVPDRGDIPAFVEWKEYDRDSFYADLKKRPEAYTTAPPNIDEFAAALEKLVSEGSDVIAITISAGISGSYGFLCKAAEAVREAHPEAKIGCVDSRRFGPCIGLIAIYAAKMAQDGRSFDETLEWVETNKNRFRQSGWLDDLSFVAKKGRITHAKAFFGTLAGVKPIGEFDENGLTTVLVKATGAKAAYELMIGYIEKTIEDPEDQTVFIAQSCRRRQAEEYKRLIEERIKPKAVVINDVYPACGINIGPGLMAAYYVGSPISKGLEAEKKIFEELSKKN